MCGIVGYVGPKNTVERLLPGLERLEYRGYDSAGIAVVPEDPGEPIALEKRAGKLRVLKEALEAYPLPAASAGIGHTRWATHGGPTDENAHPHLDESGRVALIHNGIVENYAELREELVTAGVRLVSETDTEVVAQLVGRAVAETGSLESAFRLVAPRLRGTYTLLAIHRGEPGTIVAAKHHSPLVVGFGDGEFFLGSDVAAFVSETTRAAVIDDDRIVVVTDAGIRVTDYAGTEVEPERFEVSWDASTATRGGWPSFMAKEISEQPQAVEQTLVGRVHEGAEGAAYVEVPELTELGDEVLRSVTRIIVIACGTASYAGHVAKYLIESWARVPVEVQLSHEFRYSEQIITPETLVISVSQSGETMDTLMAVKHAVALGARTISVCNTQSASIPRDSDATVYTHAGPEVAVASTKAYTAQVTALALIGLHLARVRGESHPLVVATLATLPELVKLAVETHESVRSVAHELRDTTSIIFLGRNVGYPAALEAALKVKELAYIHAEGFAAGELKHGPIALIEEGQIVVVIVPSKDAAPLMHAKVLSNVQEVRARGARVIAIAGHGDSLAAEACDAVIAVQEVDVARIAETAGVAGASGDDSAAEPQLVASGADLAESLTKIVPLQWLALEIAAAKGLDVDQPRNLAKSVTVE